MKSALMILGMGLLLGSSVAGQKKDNETLYREKVAESFVSNVSWVQTLEEAQMKAKEKRMLIFGYFSRSYAP